MFKATSCVGHNPEMLPNRDWIFWVVDPSSLKTIGHTGDKFVDDSNQSRPMPTVTRDVVPRIQVFRAVVLGKYCPVSMTKCKKVVWTIVTKNLCLLESTVHSHIFVVGRFAIVHSVSYAVPMTLSVITRERFRIRHG